LTEDALTTKNQYPKSQMAIATSLPNQAIVGETVMKEAITSWKNALNCVHNILVILE
jgi:hypothetical protein